MSYFSERENGELPRDKQEIDTKFWAAFVGFVSSYVSKNYFVEKFPNNCSETSFPIGINNQAIKAIFEAEISGISWPLLDYIVPKTNQAIDAVEFFARHISKPTNTVYHEYGRHNHLLSFDRKEGYAEYRDDVNRLFRRCRNPFELDYSSQASQVRRITHPILENLISQKMYTTDIELNRLLSEAIERFQDPRPNVREASLEKLWGGWERLKTYYSLNKKQGASELLEQAVTDSQLRKRINSKAKELTDIGNDFMIRHTETNKPRIAKTEHVDYLFHRLFALIWMLLKTSKIST